MRSVKLKLEISVEVSVVLQIVKLYLSRGRQESQIDFLLNLALNSQTQSPTPRFFSTCKQADKISIKSVTWALRLKSQALRGLAIHHKRCLVRLSESFIHRLKYEVSRSEI